MCKELASVLGQWWTHGLFPFGWLICFVFTEEEDEAGPVIRARGRKQPHFREVLSQGCLF